MTQFNRINDFFRTEVWRADFENLSKLQRGLYRSIRSFLMALRNFSKDQCPLKASALTFYTLLSVVPVIAMLFGIAKGFGLEKRLEAEFNSDLSYNQEALTYILNLANTMLENTQGGLVAGLGVAILFWSVMKVLGNIEEAFNDIWNVTQARSWTRKFSDYMSIMLLAPILIILSSSITVFISSQVESAAKSIEILGYFGPVIYIALRFIPILLTVALFSVVYLIMPNTRVSFSAALFGALFGAAIFMLVQWAYLTFQVGVSNYNAIYGGFAALPLFLVWVQTNWLVVLLGAELCVAFQNQSRFCYGPESTELSHSYRLILALAEVRCIAQRFNDGKTGPTALEISEEMQTPIARVSATLDELVDCRVISETVGGATDEIRYLPAIDLAKLDVDFVVRRLEERGSKEITRNEALRKIETAMARIREEFAKSDQNLLIRDL